MTGHYADCKFGEKNGSSEYLNDTECKMSSAAAVVITAFLTVPNAAFIAVLIMVV